MGQEFFINSQNLENKIRELLPSQGGAGAGFDLTASTQIIPIIDLTESAEGSNLREDLQSSISLNDVTVARFENATTDIETGTGYFRVMGTLPCFKANDSQKIQLEITDGSTTKVILDGRVAVYQTSVGITPPISFDFIVFLGAGDTLRGVSGGTGIFVNCITKQIASIDGTLTNPT